MLIVTLLYIERDKLAYRVIMIDFFKIITIILYQCFFLLITFNVVPNEMLITLHTPLYLGQSVQLVVSSVGSQFSG